MIPKYFEIMKPLLEYLKDKKEHGKEEVVKYLADYFKLSDEEKTRRLPSGSQIFRNRVDWARVYLYKAGLIDIPVGGISKITERGLEVLRKNPPTIDAKYLMEFEEFRKFKERSSRSKNEGEKPQEKLEGWTPIEIIEREVEKENNITKDELKNKILACSFHFFEKLVLELLVKMGYGGSFEEASKVLGKSGDEGVDGVIKEDLLGLDNIYVQAKRYQQNQSIGRKEIQSFVGALHGKGAKKGIFITTAFFTKDAKDYVEDLKDLKVILIDGDKLIDYMLKFDLGTTPKTTFVIKRVDEDYFTED